MNSYLCNLSLIYLIIPARVGPVVPDLEPVDFDSAPPEAILPGPGETVSIAPGDTNGRGTVDESESTGI